MEDRFSWQFQSFAFFEETAHIARALLLSSGCEIGFGSIIKHLRYATTCLANKCLMQMKAEVKNDLSHTCKMKL